MTQDSAPAYQVSLRCGEQREGRDHLGSILGFRNQMGTDDVQTLMAKRSVFCTYTSGSEQKGLLEKGSFHNLHLVKSLEILENPKAMEQKENLFIFKRFKRFQRTPNYGKNTEWLELREVLREIRRTPKFKTPFSS